MMNDLETLAQAIVTRLPRLPLDSVLWDGAECADYLRMNPATFPATAALPDFPKPTRVTDAVSRSGPSNRRWFAQDVIDWARGRQG